MACRHYIINGRVQGVFYRASAREQAQRLGLKGWVMNRQDGCVEAVACGDESRLAQFEAWLRQGPPMADVDKLEIRDMAEQMFDDFRVRY